MAAPTPTQSVQATLLDDCLGPLASLYDLTHGNNWTDKSGWTGWQYPGDCCGATGVTCNRAGRVLFLNLTANNLMGQLPEDILSSMTHLLLLVISHNPGLSGLIPEDLPFLPNLYTLDLSHNALNGEVPNSFYNIASPNLQHLYFDHNQLVGILPPLGGPGAENNFLMDNSSCSFTGNRFNCIDPGNSDMSCAFDSTTPLCRLASTNTPTTNTITSRPIISPPSTDYGLSTKDIIGVGIGSSLAFVVCIIIIGVGLTYRRKWTTANKDTWSDDNYSYKNYKKQGFRTDSNLGIMDTSYREGSSSFDNGDASSVVMVESPFLRRWWEQPLLIDSALVKKTEIIQGTTYRAAVDFRPNTPGTTPHPDDIRIRPNDLVVIESVSRDGEFCTGWNITSKRKGRFPAGCLSSEIVKDFPNSKSSTAFRTSPISVHMAHGTESIPHSNDTETTIRNYNNDEIMVLPHLVRNDGTEMITNVTSETSAPMPRSNVHSTPESPNGGRFYHFRNIFARSNHADDPQDTGNIDLGVSTSL